MPTYIGTPFKTYNGSGYDLHYILTHANAVIETATKKFITQAQLDLVDSILGGSTGTTFANIVTRVTSLESSVGSVTGDIATSISALEAASTSHGSSITSLNTTVASLTSDLSTLGLTVTSLSAMLSTAGDTDEIINTLQEILTFVTNAEVAENMNLTQFIQSLTPGLTFGTNLLTPNATNSYSLGSTAKTFKELHLGGTLNVAGETKLTNKLTLTGAHATSLGGSLSVTGATTLSSTTTTTGLLTASGGVTIPTGKVLTVNGTTSLVGTTTATGLITANGGITVASDKVLTVSGTTTTTGLITANGGITVKSDKVLTVGGDWSAIKLSGGTTLKSVLDTIPTTKEVVVKTTTPTAADYGRSSLTNGLIWIDTASQTPVDSSLLPSLTLKTVDASSSDREKAIKAFLNSDVYAPIHSGYNDVNLITFDTSIGPMFVKWLKQGAQGGVTIHFAIVLVDYANRDTQLSNDGTIVGTAIKTFAKGSYVAATGVPSVPHWDTTLYTLPNARIIVDNSEAISPGLIDIGVVWS